MFLLENGLLYLDPTWINELLRAVLDHRLQDSTKDVFWEDELENFLRGEDTMDIDHYQLSNVHQTFCATGTLTVSYLCFLWRGVESIKQEGVFGRLMATMRQHGVLFSKMGSCLVCAGGSDGIHSGTQLFVPVRLQPYLLKSFSGMCLSQESRRQLVFRIYQSYVPPGIMGMLMARLLGIEEVDEFRCAWSRGLALMMGGSGVLLCLNASEMHDGKAEIELNVAGPMYSDELKTKVDKMEGEMKSLLEENFPGLLFSLKGGKVRLIQGEDPSIERIASLQAHLDVRLDEIEGKLDEVAKINGDSLMCLGSLQEANFPYPHLVVVREHKPKGGGNTAGGGEKRLVLSKAVFKSFCTRVRTVGKGDEAPVPVPVRLQPRAVRPRRGKLCFWEGS